MDLKEVGIQSGELNLKSEYFPQQYIDSSFLSAEVMQRFSFKCMAAETAGSDQFFFELALMCYLYGKHLTEIPLWVANVKQFAPQRRANCERHLQHPGIESYIGEARLNSLVSSKAPDRSVLRAALAALIPHLKNQSFRDAGWKEHHYFATWLAITSHCLEDARYLVGMLKKNSEYPDGYELLKRIVEKAEQEQHFGLSIVRIYDVSVRAEFMRYFDKHRAVFFMPRPSPDWSYLFNFPLHGAYYLAWFYLQAFAPVPFERFSREDLFELLTT
jgi:hypothetical protein